ncbi:hypothetical protein ACK1KB_04855 [Chryseobacterium sp. TY3]
MIQDKDFTLRLIRQLTQALEKILLGKPDESLMQKDLDFDSLMKDIFKFDFKTLSAMSTSEIVDLVNERQDRDHVDYYEMLGNVFQFYFNQTHNLDFAEKSKSFLRTLFAKKWHFRIANYQ